MGEGETGSMGDQIRSYCNSETCFEGIDNRLMNWLLEVQKRGKKADAQVSK